MAWKFYNGESLLSGPGGAFKNEEQLKQEFPILNLTHIAVIEEYGGVLYAIDNLARLVAEKGVDTSVFTTPQAQLDEINK